MSQKAGLCKELESERARVPTTLSIPQTQQLWDPLSSVSLITSKTK